MGEVRAAKNREPSELSFELSAVLRALEYALGVNTSSGICDSIVCLRWTRTSPEATRPIRGATNCRNNDSGGGQSLRNNGTVLGIDGAGRRDDNMAASPPGIARYFKDYDR